MYCVVPKLGLSRFETSYYTATMADKEQVAELAVTYAALILHDDNVAITVSSAILSKLSKTIV